MSTTVSPDRSAMLDDLKRLTQQIKADLLERAGEVAEVDEELRKAHKAVAEGGARRRRSRPGATTTSNRRPSAGCSRACSSGTWKTTT